MVNKVDRVVDNVDKVVDKVPAGGGRVDLCVTLATVVIEIWLRVLESRI